MLVRAVAAVARGRVGIAIMTKTKGNRALRALKVKKIAPAAQLMGSSGAENLEIGSADVSKSLIWRNRAAATQIFVWSGVEKKDDIMVNGSISKHIAYSGSFDFGQLRFRARRMLRPIAAALRGIGRR